MPLPINSNTRGTNAAEGVPLQGSDAPVEKKTGNQGLKKDDFMKLLVAQLKNQDPKAPVDTKELVTQLAQLTSVEQLTTVSEKMDKLADATNGMVANQSADLIGKKVEAAGNTVRLGPLGVTTTAVNFERDAAKVAVSVINEAGRVVRTIDMEPQKAGPQVIEWDGKTDSLERASEGKYTLSVAAKDGIGSPVAAEMKVTGVVSGVSYEHGAPELVLGTTRVPLSSVTSIGQ